MSRLAQSANSHGAYIVQRHERDTGSWWLDVEYLDVMPPQQPIDAFGEWLEEQDADVSFRLVEVLDEEDR